MGRLPAMFDGKKIISRIPFTIEGRVDADSLEQDVTFPSSSFIHQDPRPFEIHRFIPRVYSIDTNDNIIDDLGDAGLVLIYFLLHDFSHDQDILKIPTTPLTLTRGTQDRCWEWAEPYTLEKSEGFSSKFNVVDTVDPAAVTPVTRIRVMFSFEGFLLNLEGT